MSEQSKEKYHFIYKTTNNINGKIYIGKHSTYNIDDGYLGSGKLLGNAIKKYGIENFTKEILFYCEDEEDAYELERQIVTEEFIKREDTYNIWEGGKGMSTEYSFKYGVPALIKYNKSSKHREISRRIGLTIGKQKLIEYNRSEIGRRKASEKIAWVRELPQSKESVRKRITEYNKTDKARKISSNNMNLYLSEFKRLEIEDPSNIKLLFWKYTKELGTRISVHKRHSKDNPNLDIWNCSKCKEKVLDIFKRINTIDNKYLLNRYKDKFELIKELLNLEIDNGRR